MLVPACPLCGGVERTLREPLATSEFDPTETSAVQCSNGLDTGFSPFQITRLSRYDVYSLKLGGRHEVAGIYWTAWWCESRVFDSFARAVGDAAMKKRRTMTTGSKRRNAPMAARRRKPSAAADANEKIALLEHRLNEALEQQTATSEVLQVISSSPGELEPVFQAMLANAMRICEAKFGIMYEFANGKFRAMSWAGVPSAYADYVKHSRVWGPGTGLGQLVRTKQTVHIRDVVEGSAYAEGDPGRVATIDLGRVRTALIVPMLRENELVGAFVIYRQEVRPFTDKQVLLVENFAAQAVIAIENARLFNETQQSLERQTATADVLKIISHSPVDLETVLDTLVETVARLCRADQAVMWRRRDDLYHLVAWHGLSEEAKEFVLAHPFAPGRGTVSGRSAQERKPIHISDVLEDPEYTYYEAQKLAGYRSLLAIPLLREDALIGIFSIHRTRVEPFTTKEIELATTFADQAVIAILKIISRSSVDLETVLDTLVETVARLCRADQTAMYRRRDDKHHLVAAWGFSGEAKQFALTHPLSPGRGTMTGRVILERRAVHMPDVLQDPEYTYSEGQKAIGYRTVLGVPLLREDTLLGIFVICRTRVDPFTDKEIDLASSFADQAVIAIENARLFDELRDRQAELRATFDNMGDGVVMFDAEGRLAAWNRNFQEILDLPDAFLSERPSYAEYFRYLAARGEYVSADLEAQLSSTLDDTRRELRFERTRPDGRVIEVRRNAVPDGGFVLIYSDVTERKRAEETIRSARDTAEAALRDLQTAQASLVHAQKMAALGELTAGIAHEIKNPLNFVNNFAGLSVELLDELRQAAVQVTGALDADKRAEIVETIGMLTGNLEKIAEHGRRADGIVRSMLHHSRGGSGDWQAADLNTLVEEALNLAYHGARARDQSFGITLERDFDRNLAPVEVVPQDVTRVLLNVIGNGFYAANKRGQEGDVTFRPVLKVTTRECGDGVEIVVRDNGVGIPSEHREKVFQPFFTTKPPGDGTGLGLSISYEIVTQQHGGTITVDSKVGGFTEFTMRLPRRRRPAAAAVASASAFQPSTRE